MPYDPGAGLMRGETVFAPEGNLLFDQRSEGAGVQHFGAVVRELGGFRVSDLIEDGGIGDQSRIGGHNAVDIGPDPKLARIQAGGKNGCRKVGAAASQSSRAAIGRGAVESGDDWDDAVF